MALTLKVKKRNGKTYGLVTGLTGTTLLNDLAKRYSKNWFITAFANPSTKKPFLLLKRSTPLSKPYSTYREWETGKRKN